MARIESLNVLLESSGKDYLAELYGKVIENVQKGTISGRLKNTDLSGNPVSGTVEAKRFAFAKSKTYGTARTNGKGDAIKAKPVTVPVNIDEELIEEVEVKDTTLYGVEGLIQRRTDEFQMAMMRKLEVAFFDKAGSVATALTTTETDPFKILEAVILQIETTKNDFVNGVPRNLISVIMQPSEYSKIRTAINTDFKNANVDSAIEEFGRINGVTVYSSIDLPDDVKMIGMCAQSIAEPVLPKAYDAEKINMVNALALELFYSYGVKEVMPDLIVKLAA